MPPTPRTRRSLLALAASLLLAACAVGPDYAAPELPLPNRWQAALPHAGDPAALVDWWRQFDDPTVAELIAAAESDSPTLDRALARIGQSRAAVGIARGAFFPSVDLAATRTRSGRPPVLPEQTVRRGTFDAAWEIDLFGGTRRDAEAAEARLAGSVAAWHEARISLAAEVALEYLALRACEAQAADTAQDLVSRRATARLAREKAQAGFAAPSDSALAEAGAAESSERLLALRADCESSIKSLTALTGLAEPALRERLAPRQAKLPRPAVLSIEALPARVVAARPDVAARERALAAASAEIGIAEAARYPRLNLLGFIGHQRQNVGGVEASGRVWSFGPTLDLPLFDAGRRAAASDAARARYDEALADYKAQVRGALREVEQSLVRLTSAGERENEAQLAADRYAQVFQASEESWRAGLGSQLDLEETRRLAIAARIRHIAVQQQNIAAWIGLYRAVGGGWTADALSMTHQFEKH